MTDRELLELAAKAAGMDVLPHPWPNKSGWFFCEHGPQGAAMNWRELRSTNSYTKPWNPLADDGDALRLAVKLRIEVDYYLTDVQAKSDDCDPVFELLSKHADASAATRRAIVRAAAAIGEAMP